VALAAFAAPGTAQAASCGDVEGTATDVRTHNTSCAEARRLLSQWDPTALPKDQFGWFCADRGDGRTLCSAGNGGGAPYFTFRLEPGPPPGTLEVIDPPGPPTELELLEPWRRFGMTSDEWSALEESVREQVCRGCEALVFGCPFGGLTIDRQGRLVVREAVMNGVGGAIARLLGRVAEVRIPGALADAAVRLPIRVKTRLATAGALPSPFARLPKYGNAGRKTTGILDVVTREFPLLSGRPTRSPICACTRSARRRCTSTASRPARACACA
jgi:hypothetical protein